MLHLLRLEWLKFRHYRIFQIMIALFAILLPGTLLIGKSIQGFPEEFGTVEMFYIFPSVWKFLGYAGNWLSFFFLGFLGVLCITNEFANKTMRQNIITGLSRKEYFTAKLLFVVSISMAATLYYIVVGLVFGFTHTPTIYTSKIFEGGDIIFRFFLMCLGYMVFGLLIGTLIRRTGLGLFLYLTYVMFIESVLRWGVHRNIVDNSSMNYYPMNALEDLVPMPIRDMVKPMMDESGIEFFLHPTTAAVVTICYTSLFLLIIYRRITRSDL